MSDQTINQTRPYLNDLNWRLKKLGRAIDQLDILIYRYRRLTAVYKELSETLDHIDVAVFDVRQEFDYMKDVYERVDL